MKLNQPYYIEPRQNASHIDLNGKWDFCWTDVPQDDFAALEWKHQTTLPKSVYHSLHEAGVLPDPYYGTNSKQYHWVDEKVWYYRKSFVLPENIDQKNAYLCFDGVAYYCRVWVNGTMIGDHEGMFGGPVCDVAEYVKPGENKLIVEVKSVNYGIKDTFDCQNRKGANTQIAPWNIVRDNFTSNGDFIVIGLWNNIRLELLDKLHLSRPYLYTKSIENGKASLHLEMELTAGDLNELRPYYGYFDASLSYQQSSVMGNTGAVREKKVRIVTTITEPDTGKVVHFSDEWEPLKDFERSGQMPKYYELQYVQKKIEIDNPKLWYPNGMGDPYLYDVTIQLFDAEKLCDVHCFRTGIRTITAEATKGNKYRHRWGEFLFSINGEKNFLKGFNWMPLDYLYSIDPANYRWCLTLAKNAGIQLLRVWNGGGMPETDTFYQLCDELGIMVWQDEMLANVDNTSNYPQDILEAQIAYNLYRIRNHASLFLLCGGNEFNCYSVGNAASMYVQQRISNDLVPHVIFHNTTPDKGSAHIYNDMEPVWYRHAYKELPFVAESGIHSFPSYATLQKQLPEEEWKKPMPNLTSEDFRSQFPALMNHFAEYAPSRVPRMLSRASHIANLDGIQLEALVEATQVQAYEFYTLMLQSMRENFPRCGGVMPWVFKRHWATVGIQIVDGMGQPGLPYYAVQNAYRPMQVIWDMNWSVIAPGEEMKLDVTLLKPENVTFVDAELRMTIYNPDLTVAKRLVQPIKAPQQKYSLGSFTPDDSFTDRCFLVNVEVVRNGKQLAETTYFIKCTSILADEERYTTYRSKPSENLYFANGPWLKPSIQAAKAAKLDAVLIGSGRKGDYTYYDVRLHNTSDVAAYPVTLQQGRCFHRQFASENFFLLKAGDVRTVRITVDSPELAEASSIEVFAWNAETVTVR